MSEGSEGHGGESGSLERSLGLKEALGIGTGIMIGAGIFVFPGLAGGAAGPAAMVSFAIGALIALMVALPTAELATAMPRSGGGYHFISRGLGMLPGGLAGLSQWLGLIFASAFYLAGFGFYASDVARRLGVEGGLPGPAVALVTGLALTGIGVLGTRKAGRLQDYVVGLLLILLAGFLGYGVLDALGVITERSLPEEFAPSGVRPIFGTTALIFTSYLGFQQIAVVSGEIRDPAKNLPRALTGSVLLVGTLYVLTMFVVTSFATPEELSLHGETALAHVAETILGGTGGILVSAAGVLATLSSANASILSSSRLVFALSRDDLLPDAVSRVNRRFNTPHVALLATGLPIAALAAAGRLETLAEVASALHLVMFGLICFTLVALRRRGPWWYHPTFIVPAGVSLALLGGAASFGLIAFMSPPTLLISGGVVAMAGLWQLTYARGVERPSPVEAEPLPVDRARILLITPIPDPPGLPDELLAAFRGHATVLLGWAEVPEQASPDQVRAEIGEEAEQTLGELADRLREAEIETEIDTVYTPDLTATLVEQSREREADIMVVLRPGEPIRRILVPVRHPDLADELARYTTWISDRFGADVILLHDDPEAAPDIEQRFRTAGVPVADLRTVEGEADRASAILEAAEDVDLVVLTAAGASSEDMMDEETEEVARECASPVMIVRIPRLFGGEPAEDEREAGGRVESDGP